jgi:hypothetical protein
MRADVAPFAVDLLLALAGLGVLFAIGLVPRGPTMVLAALGLGYLTGSAIVPLALTVLLVVGIPFTLTTFAVVVAACIGAGLLRLWLRPPDRSPRSGVPIWRRSWRSWTIDAWVVGIFVVLFGAFALVGMATAWKLPIVEWDAWSIWARKAQMLTGHDTLVTNFFASPSYSWIHLDYPIQFPLWEALHSRAGGSFQMQDVLRHVWLLLVAFVGALAYLLRDQVKPLIWAPILLLFAAAPGAWQQLLTGYADLPMAMFVCLGAISLALWLSEGDGRALALAAVMLAAAANTKNEGLMAAVALLLVAWVATLAMGLRLKPFLVAAGAVGVSVVPWHLWLSAHDIKTEISVSKGLDPSFLFDRFDRVGPTLEGISRELGDPARWLYILPLAALVVVTCLVSGIGRRVAGFYLAGFALLAAGFIWSYLASPNSIEWLLATSVNRTVTALILICLAALVHLSGLLFARLVGDPKSSGTIDPPDPESGSDPGRSDPIGRPRTGIASDSPGA